MKITFNRPSLMGNELAYLEEAVQRGHTSMNGAFSEKVESLLKDEMAAADVLLTTSCTDALEMSALLLDIEPGDVVIVPSFTFVSTALAFARQGAEIRFCDIEPTTLGADPDSLAALMDESVRAVVPVHYAGVGCRIEEILEVVKPFDRCSVIEDNAHGLFGTRNERTLGEFGRFSTLSFHETKNFTCGEGGALIINDPADVERAHILRDKGTNRQAFLQGEVDKYTWVDTGSSFGMSDLLAGYLLAQLEERDEVLARRKRVFDQYSEMLEPHAGALGFRLPVVPDTCVSAQHMFYVLLPDRARRDSTLTAMKAADVHPTFHYVPLHSSEGGRKFSARRFECPVTDDISGRLLRLPFYTTMREEEIKQVITIFLDSLDAREARPTRRPTVEPSAGSHRDGDEDGQLGQQQRS